MRVLVPKEIKSGEKRVALVPDIISKLTRAGLTVAIESGAGTDSQATDSEFQAAGAEIIATANMQNELGKADVVASVQPLTPNQFKSLKKVQSQFHSYHQQLRLIQLMLLRAPVLLHFRWRWFREFHARNLWMH